jgi:regulator of RNase E activity RraA
MLAVAVLAASKSEQRADVGDVLQTLQEGNEVEQVIVRGIVYPTLNWYRIV